MRLLKQIGFVVLLGLLAVTSFAVTSALSNISGSRSATTASQSAAGGSGGEASRGATGGGTSYCELTFPADTCPADPKTFAIARNGTLRDTWEGSDKLPERCMRRAWNETRQQRRSDRGDARGLKLSVINEFSKMVLLI